MTLTAFGSILRVGAVVMETRTFLSYDYPFGELAVIYLPIYVNLKHTM